MEPLKPNDEVFIKSLTLYGKVLRARPGDAREQEEMRNYEVQITRYFGRTDLEPYDPKAERENREQLLREKTARLAAAHQNVERALASGSSVSSAIAHEFMSAGDELWRALGHPSLLKSNDNPSK
jgi:hypothetical protein